MNSKNAATEKMPKSITRKHVYIALATIGAIAGLAVSALLAFNKPVPEEIVTETYDSSILYASQSPTNEFETPAAPASTQEAQDSERINTPAEDTLSDNSTPAPSTEPEDCETPDSDGGGIVIIELAPCWFAYFEIDSNGQLTEISADEATRQRLEDNSETVDWAPTPPTAGEDSSNSTGSNEQPAPAPEPVPVPTPTPVEPAPMMCPIDRATNPAVYDACRAGFVMPTALVSTGIQSCSVDENGRIRGIIGLRLEGGSFKKALWRGANGDDHSGTTIFNTGGLNEDSGTSLINKSDVTVMFWSMDPRYDGVIAEHAFHADTIADVSKCF